MYVKYTSQGGSYTHSPGEVEFTTSSEAIMDDLGNPIGYRDIVTLRGMLRANADVSLSDPSVYQAAITSKILEMQRIYSYHFGTLGLYHDNGTQSAHIIGPCRIIRAPSFPDGSGAEYTTYRTYEIVVDSLRRAVLLDRPQILKLQQGFHVLGGGPRIVYRPTLRGTPLSQISAERTTFRIVQTGQAIGTQIYPIPTPPQWPLLEIPTERRVVNSIVPYVPQMGAAQYSVDWSYLFETNEMPVIPAGPNYSSPFFIPGQ
jgi:hypothetical protein